MMRCVDSSHIQQVGNHLDEAHSSYIFPLQSLYTVRRVAELSGSDIYTIAPGRPEDIFLAVKLYVILQKVGEKFQ